MDRVPTVFISAGEVSGDLHAARLVEALLTRVPALQVWGVGSHRMRQAGVEVRWDVTRYSAVGLLEHLPGLRPIAKTLSEVREALVATRPDVVVLVDYQGMNMQIARAAKALGIPTVYYISPQEWIWGLPGGCRKVAEVSDLILAIFEKEAAAYRKTGANVEFIGHPLLDMVPPDERGALAHRLGVDVAEPIVALFPGSRRMELSRLLPPMLEACEQILAANPRVQFLLPVASPDLAELVASLRAKRPGVGVKLVSDVSGMALMRLSDVVLAASGTVVLEAAVVGTPVVAAYKIGGLAAFIAKRLMRGAHVTLPNIVMDEGIVPELLQGEANGARMAEEVLRLLQNPGDRARMVARLAAVRAKLGTPGAVGRAADRIVERLGASQDTKEAKTLA
ncbi:lipid-A-disaccharide synthase [bacterium]|nr:lipid-A-disaccharide synthase [bacterium]